jgi:hypothetical protein
MSEEPNLSYYQVTTREDVSYCRCGEVGDIIERKGFGTCRFTSIRPLSIGQLEVKTCVDEYRAWEIRTAQELGMFQGSLTPDGEEVSIISNAFLTREEAEAHAIQLIEAEISYFRKKQEKFRNG